MLLMTSAPAPRYGLLAVCLAAVILPLSFSAGAIATPAIGRDLGGSPLALAWITNAFMLTFGSLLLAAGTLADTYGRKRLFVTGVGLYILVSLALGIAPSVLWLDTLRAMQGVAAAAALAGGSASLAELFDGHARTRAYSALGSSFGVGLALGPILSGWLISQLGWRAVFVTAALIGALALVLGVRHLRESRDPAAGRVDGVATVLFSAALGLLTWAIMQVPVDGWANSAVWGKLLAAALLLAGFVISQQRAARPMLDLSLLRYPRFLGVQLLPIATCYCFVVLLVALPLRFVGIEGRSEVDAGLAMLALCGPMLVVPSVAAWLVRFASAGVICALGLVVAAFGLWWLGRIDAGAHPLAWVAPMLVIGVGTGLPWGLMDGLSVSVVPKERAGMATGIFSTTRVAGEGIALAIVTALSSGLIARQLGLALPRLPADQVAQAAQYLGAGEMTQARALLGAAPREVLAAAVASAFAEVTWALIAITLASAAVVLLFLAERPVTAQQTSLAAESD
ncbi:MFS transporter [Pseudomonas sp. RIT-To-2]|uniref:MFS transporter n=1 Tax=Pseudomonas sp. RIT-To-2 TaxID=3462541 RepID=UPI002412ED22